jgi:leukotriene-A4 hydrolase
VYFYGMSVKFKSVSILVVSFVAVVSVAPFGGCGLKKKDQNVARNTMDTVSSKDVHTQSNADVVKVEHLALDITVDMAAKQISGNATWFIDNSNKQKELILDTDDLTIDSTVVDGKGVPFTLDKPDSVLGSALHIPINENSKIITVYYKTGKDARALQWLSPEQTHDKKHPFLFTQSESIYARSWIPCPDGPGIRFSYSARVEAPKGLMALMSAENSMEKNDSGLYHFKMDSLVPAYLMALAVGDVTFKAIDERTGVYAEPGMIDKAHWEFENVGRMVGVAEQLYGPYRWGRYDVLVLPPGFPIGGMENPRLTFCTPTIIAGDRSLVSLIAHELAHSWSGNLVTNATWDDFWLNEGFTVYFERRIMEQMMGASYADMLWELGYQDLEKSAKELAPRDTWLKLDLKGRDPDDGLTDIPYEKGAHFLRLLEKTVGREQFDRFLSQYFAANAFKTMTTEKFLTILDTSLIKGDSAVLKKLRLQEWVYGPGIPANCPAAHSERFLRVDAEREKFLHGAQPGVLNTVSWTSHEWLHFLRKMPATLSVAQMGSLDGAFNFSNTGNSEIADQWYVMAVRTGYSKAYPAMERFLSSVGRRKFLEPLYGEMMNTPAGAAMANRLYDKYRQNYHPLAQGTLDRLVRMPKAPITPAQ